MNGVTPHFISVLKLDSFRNHPALGLECDERSLVLTGPNGAGKTNVLEAVSFLSPGRGMRRATLDAVARQSGDGRWSVFAELNGACGPAAVGTGLADLQADAEPLRRVRINGVTARANDELLDHARILWLTPAMDGLFAGPAAERRRFFDRLVLAVHPTHGRRVADFEKAMRARNRLLSEESPDPRWLDAIEIQMAETAVAIAAARAELVELLSGVIVAQSTPGQAFPDAVLQIDGTLETLAREIPASDLEAQYCETLRAGRRADAAAGRTLQGPHRSDLLVTHRPKAMAAALCSTGEQKALLIGIVLAHARLVADTAGLAPILLLDEIAAHLDALRREALFERIGSLGSQAWMTGTDPVMFEAAGARAQFFSVKAGEAKRERGP
jgi:DNA replication and repair protein RecF